MAITTGTAILGATAIGAGTALYSSSQQSKAAKTAADIQTQANDESIEFLREQRDLSEQELRPYVNQGNQARGIISAHLGMGGTDQQLARTPVPSAGGIYTPNSAPSAQQVADSYFEANPDVYQAWVTNSHGARDQYPNPSDFAEFHINTMGRQAGRPGIIDTPNQSPGQVPSGFAGSAGRGGGRDMTGISPGATNFRADGAVPGSQPIQSGFTAQPGGQPAGQGAPTSGDSEYMTPEQAQEAAWENYRTSTPYGKIGDYQAEEARGEFLDLAGGQGTALSGRTARGMAEVGEEAAMRNFNSYMGMMSGFADQGYSASTGIASAGQNYAQGAANLTRASGAAQAGGRVGSANAWASGLSDAAGWAGWGMGQAGWLG